jgi:aryl-alcohol dehydrogenase-like predicted oxidoreductase
MPMDYRRLGLSSLKVSPLCLGTLMFGDLTGDSEAARIVASAADAGVNFIDTADSYAEGASELCVGRLLAGTRRRWMLASKVGNPVGPGPMDGGLSRRWLMYSIDQSLRRLGTDYLDLWYLHLPDPDTTLVETLAAVGDVIRSGKVLHWGFTNYRGWEVAEIIRVADLVGTPRPAVCQAYYNLVNRMPEYDLLPACAHFGIGIATYSPLARGVLTGKYLPGRAAPEGTRADRKEMRIIQVEFREESKRIAQDIAAYGAERGLSNIDFAVMWLLNNRLVGSVVTGPRTFEQWECYLGAMRHRFTADDEAFANTLVPPGHSSTPGFIDPKFPPTGRVSCAK